MINKQLFKQLTTVQLVNYCAMLYKIGKLFEHTNIRWIMITKYIF